MITIVKCSIPSQLNNMPRVVVTDFRLHHASSLIIVWLHSLSGVRPNKLDLLFLISHFLDLGAGGRLLFITSLFYLMSRSHEACLT